MEETPNQNTGNENMYNGNPNPQNMNNNNMYNGNPNPQNMNNNNMYNGNPNPQNMNNNNAQVINDWGTFDANDIENNKAMAIISYILAVIPYFVEKNSKWVRFHAVQGMNILIISIIVMLVSAIFSIIPVVGNIINVLTSLVSIVLCLLSIMGIVNVCKGEAKELPIIDKIKIIKK